MLLTSPAVAMAAQNYPGVMCQPMGNGSPYTLSETSPSPARFPGIKNTSSVQQTFYCPIPHTAGKNISSVGISVDDRHTAQDVSCTIETLDRVGTPVAQGHNAVVTAKSRNTGIQLLDIVNVATSDDVAASTYLRCSLPASTAVNGFVPLSRIISYIVDEE